MKYSLPCISSDINTANVNSRTHIWHDHSLQCRTGNVLSDILKRLAAEVKTIMLLHVCIFFTTDQLASISDKYPSTYLYLCPTYQTFALSANPVLCCWSFEAMHVCVRFAVPKNHVLQIQYIIDKKLQGSDNWASTCNLGL